MSTCTPLVCIVASGTIVACATPYEPGPRPTVIAPWPDPEIDLSAELYHPGILPVFEIELAQASIDALERAPRTYVRGTFRHGDRRVNDVGIRLKGTFSFRTLTGKAAFKLHFGKFVAGQRFHGLKRMTFNNAIEDRSFIAERLAYRVFRDMGVPAPRANNAHLFVNGQDYGLYVNVETEDKTFLRTHFSDDSGHLYEGGGNDFTSGSEHTFDLEEADNLDGHTALQELIDAVADVDQMGFSAALSAHLDIEPFLRYCALEAIVGQWDGYAYSRFGFNNFRLYHNPDTRRFQFIPSGLDMSMKALYPDEFAQDWNGGSGAHEHHIEVASPRGLLLQACLRDDLCAAAYHNEVALVAEQFANLDLTTETYAMYQQIRDLVYADPRKEFDNQVFEYFIDQVLEYIRSRPQTVAFELSIRM